MSERETVLNHLKPGDIIEWRGSRTGQRRLWWVHGCHYGAVGQESVIALEAIDCDAAWDEIDLPILHVPAVLTRHCRIAGHADSCDEAAAALKAKAAPHD